MLFGLIDQTALEHLVGLDPQTMQQQDRTRLERILDLSVWINLYRPEVVF